ncbi:MAG: hypothetical protein HY322_17380 [Betaproteobacteria bacterium]|nr:hypothetical protein [Betaproteobacteria bacterium]
MMKHLLRLLAGHHTKFTIPRLTAVALAATLPAPPAHAQAWPSKPLRIVVAFTPGGGNDTIARLIGPKLTESLGQQVVVENRPGGGSAIASELVALARARPGEITFGSAGIGSGSHFGGEVFRLATGTNLLHVPYKGSALVTTALLSGEVMMGVSNPVSSRPDVVKHLASDAAQPITQTPAEFGAFLRGEIARWQKVANAAGIRAK